MSDTANLPGFSVVTPTFGRLESLRRVLAGLSVQDYPRDRLEVLVVADGDDRSAQQVEALAPGFPFRLRSLWQANQGPAAARNLGLRHARGPYVVFLDDDVVPAPDLVLAHARAHREQRIVAIGPLLPSDQKPSPWVRWEARAVGEQYRAMVAGEWPPSPWQFYTGNASVELEELLRAGGFDVRFRRAEDVELGLRLAERGLRFVFCPEARGVHVAERSFGSWLDAGGQYGRNDVIFGQTRERVVRQFPNRHPLTRALIRTCIRRPAAERLLAPAARAAITTAGALRLEWLTGALCGAAFNLNYWFGVMDELGPAGTARLLAEAEGLARAADDVVEVRRRA